MTSQRDHLIQRVVTTTFNCAHWRVDKSVSVLFWNRLILLLHAWSFFSTFGANFFSLFCFWVFTHSTITLKSVIKVSHQAPTYQSQCLGKTPGRDSRFFEPGKREYIRTLKQIRLPCLVLYIYVCMYICVCVYIYICVCVCVYIYIHTGIGFSFVYENPESCAVMRSGAQAGNRTAV